MNEAEIIHNIMEKEVELEAIGNNEILHPLCPMCKVYEMVKPVGIREYYCTKCGHMGVPKWSSLLDIMRKED